MTLLLVLGESELDALALSLRVGLVATLVSLPPGILAAWVLARGRFPGRVALDALLSLPLVLPPVVTGYVLLVVCGRQGPLGSLLDRWFGISLALRWQGAALAAAVVSFPLLVRAIRLSIEAIDPRLEEAARTLGAGRWRVFLRVTLPLATPGILAGATLALARSFGEFGATITFVGNVAGETRTVPLAMFTALQSVGGESAALRLALLSILLAYAAMAVHEIVMRRATRRRETT